MTETFTPGPWRWWTSNSWRRLKRDDMGILQNVLEPYVMRDGHPDIFVSEADMALIAAAPDLRAALTEAIIQIEYLHAKFNATGTGEAVLARGRAALVRAHERVSR